MRALLVLLLTLATDPELPSAPVELRAWVPRELLVTWNLEGPSDSVPVYASTDLTNWVLWATLPGGTVHWRVGCEEPRRFFRVANTLTNAP